jgi:myosin heavy subunit
LGLEGGATSFHYLSQGKTVTIDNVDDAKGFEEVCKAMNIIEVSPQEQVQKSTTHIIIIIIIFFFFLFFILFFIFDFSFLLFKNFCHV